MCDIVEVVGGLMNFKGPQFNESYFRPSCVVGLKDTGSPKFAALQPTLTSKGLSEGGGGGGRYRYRQSLSEEAIEVKRIGWILLCYFKTGQWQQPAAVRDISSVVYLSVIGCFNLLVRRPPPLRQAHHTLIRPGCVCVSHILGLS